MSPEQEMTNRGIALAADTGRASSGQDDGQEAPRSASAEDGADTPPQPVSRISKADTTQECWCGCGSLTSPGKRWKPGHDQKAKGIIKRAVKEGKINELSLQLKEYGEERGMI